MSAAILDQIAKEVATCTRCSLCKTRTRTVPGEGSSQARLLFIGEAPGYHEDQQGRPFVGQSGQLLNKLLNLIKIPREDVFIANVVKCRPLNNMDPTPEQIAACKPYLDRQIGAINPRLIVTLGRFSMARYWPGQRISQVHGQAKAEGGRMLMPMFHPAAALRDDRTKALFKEDGLTIPALMERAEEIARTELWGYAAEEPQESQPVLSPKAPTPKPVEAVVNAGIKSLREAPAAPLEDIEVIASVEAPTVPEVSPISEVAEVVKNGAKPPRERKPKAAPELKVAPISEAALPETTPATKAPTSPRPRKKREPGIGEQLTMF